MYVSTLQALNIAITAIQQLPDNETNRIAITKLKNLKKQDRYIHWTKEMVFEVLDKWQEEHGLPPTTTILGEPDMPHLLTIQKLFNMKASAFLNLYYPREKYKTKQTSPFHLYDKEDWLQIFAEQYDKIKPSSCKEYNVLRDEKTPTWETIAKHLGYSTWTELIKNTDVDTSCLKLKTHMRNTTTKTYIVESTSCLYEKLERLMKK